MPESTPQAAPGSGQSVSSSGGPSAPSLTPTPGAASEKSGCGCGGATVSAGPGASMAGPPPSLGDAAPSLRPPSEGTAGGVTAWLNNKRITALWGINQNRNSWVHIDGTGWRKLANNSDSAIVALTMLGAHAREKNSPVNYREESDGMIREMYVF